VLFSCSSDPYFATRPISGLCVTVLDDQAPMATKRTVKREYPPVPECFRGEAPDDPYRQTKAVRVHLGVADLYLLAASPTGSAFRIGGISC
jgi:hypothetical protein